MLGFGFDFWKIALMSGGATGALAMLNGEAAGLAIDFTTSIGVNAGVGEVAVTGHTTNLSNVPADSFLTQSGTSPKLVLGSDSLYRWTPHNLILRSELLTNASWLKVTTTVTAGATDPDGGTGAFTLTTTGASAVFFQTYSPTIGASLYHGIWIKRRTGTGNVWWLDNGGARGPLVTVTSSWTQVSTGLTGIGTTYFGFEIAASGDELDVWHPQINRGTTPTSYHVTTSSAWYGVPIEWSAT